MLHDDIKIIGTMIRIIQILRFTGEKNKTLVEIGIVNGDVYLG